MRYTINHELPQRIRLTLSDRVSVSDAAALEPMLASWTGIERVRVYPRIRSVAVWSRDELAKTALLGRLDALTPEQLSAAGAQTPGAPASVDAPVVSSIARLAGSYLMRRWFMPPALRTIWAGIHYLGFLRAGLASLARGRLDVPVLDAVLTRFGSLLEQTAGRNVVNVPGAGAAGGMGAALMALLGAELRPGFAIVNEVTGYERLLQTTGIDLVITGEGQMNAQSLMGKLPVEAARLAKKYGVRCVAIVGSRGEGAEHAEQCGFSSVYELMTEGMTLEYSMTHTAELVEQAVKQIDLTGGQV